MPDSRSDIPQEPPLFLVRAHRVILDADLARLYGVPTKALNQAIKRNPERFPSDFAFQLIPEEMEGIRSQFAAGTSDRNWSQTVTSSENTRSTFEASAKRHRGKIYLPWAFTEHGALMAANVLRSDPAARMAIHLVRAFVALRRAALAHEGMARRLAEAEQALLRHDAELDDLYWKLEPLLAPLAEAEPRRRMGFARE